MAVLTNPTRPRVTIPPETKKHILDLLKGVNLEEKVIEDEDKRKWYTFGAYDFARKLS